MQPGKLRSLHRLVDESGTFAMLAIDQRPPVEKLVADRRHLERAPIADVIDLKRLLAEELASHASAVLLDPLTAIGEMHALLPGQGLLVTLEDATFIDEGNGRRSSTIDDWSVDQIKRLGGDGVKLLVWYRPDADPAILTHQQELVEVTGAACRRFDIPFVLELLLHPLESDRGTPPAGVRRAELVQASVETFTPHRFGVDVFKLESPIHPSELPAFSLDRDERAVFRDLSQAVQRPWVLLSGGVGRAEFVNALRYAYDAGASGYLAGRSIWWDAVEHFPDWDHMRSLLGTEAAGFMDELNQLTRTMATPVYDRFGVLTEELLEPPGTDFRHRYPPIIGEWTDPRTRDDLIGVNP